ncbi:MAG: DoxX family protein [Polyangiaceae bacterium]
MSSNASTPAPASPSFFDSKGALWTGRALSGLASLALLMDWAMKVAHHPEAVKGTIACGYPESAVLTIGLLGMSCWILYVVPRTAVLGAILWTGYLGGAVATHVRLGNPLFSHILSPVYVAIFLWGGLWLRERRLRALVPVTHRI